MSLADERRAGLVHAPGSCGDGDLPVFDALDYFTEENILAGEYSAQTVIDLVRELRWALAPKIADANMRKKMSGIK